MRLMNEVLKRFLGKFVIVYLDEILIFSKTKGENLEHIRQVLYRLKEEKMLINLKNYSFIQKEIVYLGFLISVDGLKMDPEKVKEILEWSTSKNIGEVRSFHGLASFYKKFIRNFSVVGNAMNETMRGDNKEFKWTHGDDKSFESLKQRVAELPILALPNFNKVFQVECDTSGNAIGAILCQEGKLVAFSSEKLDYTERKYSIYD